MKIYVGNINSLMRESELQKIFEIFGEVLSTTIIRDNGTGNSKGYGLVEMKDAEAAKRAVEELDGRKVADYKLTVSLSEQRKSVEKPNNEINSGEIENNRINSDQTKNSIKIQFQEQEPKVDVSSYSKEFTENGQVKIKFNS